MIQKQTICALAGLVLTGVFGHASVIYTFVGTGIDTPDEAVAFELTVPTFITLTPAGAAVSFTCAQLDSSTNCSDAPLTGVGFSLGPSLLLNPFAALVQFDATNGTLYNFNFANDAFATPGIYNAHGYESVTLTVASPSVPEPKTLSLVATGLLGGFCAAHAIRRKRKDVKSNAS